MSSNHNEENLKESEPTIILYDLRALVECEIIVRSRAGLKSAS